MIGGRTLEVPVLRLLVLLLALALAGCPPVLNNADDDDLVADDDDATMGDDDDATWGDDDDDDATWGDDDDDISSECQDPGFVSTYVTGVPANQPTWYTGEGTIDGDILVLNTPDGDTLEWTLGDDAGWFPQGALGTTSVYWWTPGMAPWGGDFLFAVEFDGGFQRFVSGFINALDYVEIPEFGVYAWASNDRCAGEWMEDGCGLWSVVTMEVEVATAEGVALLELAPTSGQGSPNLSAEGRLGRQYAKVWCDDVPELEWAFALMINMLTWDG